MTNLLGVKTLKEATQLRFPKPRSTDEGESVSTAAPGRPIQSRFNLVRELSKDVIAGRSVTAGRDMLTDALFFTCALSTGEEGARTIEKRITMFLEHGANPVTNAGRTLFGVFAEEGNKSGMQAVENLGLHDPNETGRRTREAHGMLRP